MPQFLLCFCSYKFLKEAERGKQRQGEVGEGMDAITIKIVIMHESHLPVATSHAAKLKQQPPNMNIFVYTC